MRKWIGAVAVAAALLAWAGASSAQGRCATQWNGLLRQWETRCDDGSSATEQYNQLLRQYERTITPSPSWGQPSQPLVRCITRYNSLLRQYEQVCY